MTMVTLEQGLLLQACQELISSDAKSELNPAFIIKAILSGNAWALGWKYPSYGIVRDADVPPAVIEVARIVEVWSNVQGYFNQLPLVQKAWVAEQAKLSDVVVVFPGFDRLTESQHLNIAKFMIHDLNRFSEFRYLNLDAHRPMLPEYRRMRAVYEQAFTKEQPHHLSADALVIILRSRFLNA